MNLSCCYANVSFLSFLTLPYVHTYIHACIHTYMHAYIHACMHTYICIYIYIYIYIYIDTYIYIYIFTHIHMYIYCWVTCSRFSPNIYKQQIQVHITPCWLYVFTSLRDKTARTHGNGSRFRWSWAYVAVRRTILRLCWTYVRPKRHYVNPKKRVKVRIKQNLFLIRTLSSSAALTIKSDRNTVLATWTEVSYLLSRSYLWHINAPSKQHHVTLYNIICDWTCIRSMWWVPGRACCQDTDIIIPPYEDRLK